MQPLPQPLSDSGSTNRLISDLHVKDIREVTLQKAGGKEAGLEITGTLQGRSVTLVISSEKMTSANLKEIIQQNGITITNQPTVPSEDYKGTVGGKVVTLNLSSNEKKEFNNIHELRLVQTAKSTNLVCTKSILGSFVNFIKKELTPVHTTQHTQRAMEIHQQQTLREAKLKSKVDNDSYVSRSGGVSSPTLNPPSDVRNSAVTASASTQQTERTTTVNNVSGSNMISRLDRDLSVAKSVVRSRDGAGGVYFLQTNRTDALVLKFAENPALQIIADRLFLMFNFKTPNYTLLDKNSAIGTKALKMLKDLGTKFYSKSPTLGEEKGKFNDQVNKSDLMVMENIDATSFRQLSIDDRLEALKNPKVLHALGEMLFLDTIIGNDDRLDWGHCNPGNLMIQNKDKTDVRERPIALIDHEFKVSSENFESIKSRITLLLNKDGQRLDKIINRFISTLKLGDKDKKPGDEDKNIDITQMKNEIKKGIETAKKEFLEKFTNKEAINDLLTSQNSTNAALFLTLIELVRNLEG